MSNLINKAFELAKEAHNSIYQKRRDGQNYIVHPMGVVEFLKQYITDEEIIAAAYLHDVIEDVYPRHKYYSLQLITERTNVNVASLVNDLTNEFTSIKYPNYNRKKRKELENKRVNNISNRAKIIKIADIWHNCHNIENQEIGFAKLYIRETIEQMEFLKGCHDEMWNKVMNLLQNKHRLLNPLPQDETGWNPNTDYSGGN